MRLILITLLVATPAAAQDLFPRFSVTHGFYRATFSTDVRVDPEEQGLQGTAINIERDLGLQSGQQVGRFAVQWRPFQRHEIAYSRLSTSRDGFRAIDREIVFQDEIYPVQALVTTSVDLDSWDATYTFWARRTDRNGAGIMLGVTGLSIDSRLGARTPGQSLTIEQRAATDVPVAMIGAQGRLALARRLYLSAAIATLPQVDIDTYSGSALSGTAAMEYLVARRLRLGLAWNYFSLDGRVDDPQFGGELGLTMSGAEAFVRVAF
ncbi:MAG TPA: hypothetical protein VMS98_20380 [Thermoanaerobaculia bacterium]|nr:hypothetical protein [Thermoanaerobaculia bacterium]